MATLIDTIEASATRVLHYAFEDMPRMCPHVRMDGAFPRFTIVDFDAQVMRRLIVACSAERFCISMQVKHKGHIEVELQAYCRNSDLLGVMDEYHAWQKAQ